MCVLCKSGYIFELWLYLKRTLHLGTDNRLFWMIRLESLVQH